MKFIPRMISRFLLCSALILSLTIYSGEAFGDILITLSSSMEEVIFDGKWSHGTEWKQSSWDQISTNHGVDIHLRTAHQGDFIYVLADVVSDQSLDRGTDRAVVCFDGNNSKSVIPEEDDYCFLVILDGKQSFVYQGGSPLSLNGHFNKISNDFEFIGVGSSSDQNDRYSKIPHASYEFKIPLKLIQRSDNYGFYISVYDAHLNKFYSWPSNTVPNSTLEIPSPSKWGTLVSPDKSIPEFGLPVLALISSIILIIFVSKFRKITSINNVRFTSN